MKNYVFFKKFLRRFFLQKEIISKKGILHFQRWRIINLGFIAIYIHKIFVSDEDLHEHSHPWWFFSKIIAGGYIETRGNKGELYSAGDWLFRRPEDFHKITVVKPVTSIVITGKREHDWGYNTEEGYMDHDIYRTLKRLGYWRKDDEID